MSQPICLKDLLLTPKSKKVGGSFITIGSKEFYKISNYDLMRPFFISLVGHSDHWLFISTTGGLSAGRKNSESALFPYYTDDKIEDSAEITGSKTIIRVKEGNKLVLWEPFSIRNDGVYKVQRNLYKNRAGNIIIFEEINEDLNLSFQYSWNFSEEFGFVKKSSITSHADQEVTIDVLDGIQNILPYGVNSAVQANTSNLVNAYRKSELHPDTGLGMFMLSAIIVDKAEPSEALKTTTVWSAGIDRNAILLSSIQVDKFRNGMDIENEPDVRAERGAYFVSSTINIASGKTKSWQIVSEVNQDHADVFGLIAQLKHADDLMKLVEADLEHTNQSLKNLVGKSDGIQLTNDKLAISRHYANTLFNIMRGGIFDEDYKVDKKDFISYIHTINNPLSKKQSDFFDSLNHEITYQDLIASAQANGNADVVRLCYEYLPLTFSRRHGDPSRPWNKFTIAIQDEDGNKLRSYEGNWRDIFQNWEALAISFPGYIISMITKFVNASTIDGYNPYRITREGIDWEIIEPDDPWSYIGYWGDHQIIYLQKLLELAISNNQEQLSALLNKRYFVYANVPYRIKGYSDLVANPKDTVDFDDESNRIIEERVATIGSDGKMVFAGDGLLRANLAEKLLVPFLAKMTNFIPGGGIWLNTQRPEWNDANNALVGNGVSMVTLYYMRRFASSMIKLFDGNESLHLNKPVLDLLLALTKEFSNRVSDPDKDARQFVDVLGKLGEDYRTKAYHGFSGETGIVSSTEVKDFFSTALKHIDHTIKLNRREDGLYHSYNLVQFHSESIEVDHLYEMLEGQVAVLSSGLLAIEETLEVLDKLKASKIYREDQYSYMLYPNRELPKFLEKNTIPKEFIEKSELARALLASGNTKLLSGDVNGNCHFNGYFNNAESLKSALENLKASYSELVEKEYDQYLDVFEQMFNHKAFTGRSGTFYGYEGLGSIYWHMVSKLLLAVQENIYAYWDENKGSEPIGRLIDHYYEIRAGIGINKSPALYGSFPTDPYSHTPGNKGVQQPGMTGQVKEDILNRWAELGVYVRDRKIHFAPIFLNDAEYLGQSVQFDYYELDGKKNTLNLDVNQLAFTYCQVPVIYEKGDDESIEVTVENKTETISGKILPVEYSKELFERSGKIQKIKVINS